MKAIAKQYFAELAQHIPFPVVIFYYETGKILTYNTLAAEIIGEKQTSIYRIWKGIRTKEPEDEKSFNQSWQVSGISYRGQNGQKLFIDAEFNCIYLEDKPVVISFFERSCLESFKRAQSVKLPRMIWMNRRLHRIGSNRSFLEDQKEAKDFLFGEQEVQCWQEKNRSKVHMDNQSVVYKKQPVYEMVQLVDRAEDSPKLAKLHRIPLFDKNSTIMGVVLVYTVIISAKEQRKRELRARQKNYLLSQILGRGKQIVIMCGSSLTDPVEYVSPNISQLGITEEEIYEKRWTLSQLIGQEKDSSIQEQLHRIEQDKLDNKQNEITVLLKKECNKKIKLYICRTKVDPQYFGWECLLEIIE